VLVPIHKFKAQNAQQVYDAVYQLPWETLFLAEHRFLVESVVKSEYFNNSMFCNQRVKDAVVDRFRNCAGKRPNVDRNNAEIRIYAHVNADAWMLALDTSGEPLYKRGYKTEHHEASMKEVLAAGLLKFKRLVHTSLLFRWHEWIWHNCYGSRFNGFTNTSRHVPQPFCI